MGKGPEPQCATPTLLETTVQNGYLKNNYWGLPCKSKQYHSSVVAMERSTSCVHSQDNDCSFGWDRKCRSGGIGITTSFPFMYKNTSRAFQPSLNVSLKVYIGCWTCDTVYFGSWTCGSELRFWSNKDDNGCQQGVTKPVLHRAEGEKKVKGFSTMQHNQSCDISDNHRRSRGDSRWVYGTLSSPFPDGTCKVKAQTASSTNILVAAAD